MRVEKSRYRLLVLICICGLISAVFSVEKADHFKGQSNFNPGTCKTATCLISGPSNGWSAFQRGLDPANTYQFQI